MDSVSSEQEDLLTFLHNCYSLNDTLVCKKNGTCAKKMTPVAKKMTPVAKKMSPVAKKMTPPQKK